jgi:hypothetical protein
MGSGGVFPAEMPERGRSLVDPLDADTAERLVAGRVGPDDAPPGYAGVARVLQAAAGPAGPEELAGREAALALFRAYGPSPGRRHRPRGRPRGLLRGRLAALALAGALAAGGLWMAAAAPPPAGLPSRAGAPQSGGAGSGAPGLVTQARPTTPTVTSAGANARTPAQPSARAPSTGHGDVATASGAPHHGAKQHRPGKPPKPKPEKPKPEPKPEKPKPDPGPKDKPKPEHQR